MECARFFLIFACSCAFWALKPRKNTKYFEKNRNNRIACIDCLDRQHGNRVEYQLVSTKGD